MRAFWTAAVLAVGLSVLTPALAGQDTPIVVGQVVPNSPDSPAPGWRRFSSAMVPVRTTANGVTTETHGCCVLVLARGDDYVIVRTEAVERNPRGGVLSERVLQVQRLTRAASETPTECGLLWITPAFSLKDGRTQMVRSVVVTDKGFETLTWKDPDRRCDYDG